MHLHFYLLMVTHHTLEFMKGKTESPCIYTSFDTVSKPFPEGRNVCVESCYSVIIQDNVLQLVARGPHVTRDVLKPGPRKDLLIRYYLPQAPLLFVLIKI